LPLFIRITLKRCTGYIFIFIFISKYDITQRKLYWLGIQGTILLTTRDMP